MRVAYKLILAAIMLLFWTSYAPAAVHKPQSILGAWCTRLDFPSFHESIEFDGDNTHGEYRTFIHEHPDEDGIWSITGEKIMLKYASGEFSHSYTIVKLTNDTLILQTSDEPKLSMEYYFRTKCQKPVPFSDLLDSDS
jgi:hypothetical protein